MSSNLTSPTIFVISVYVYVLRSVKNGKRYVGITDDLKRRLLEHQNPKSTVGRQLGQFELLHTEAFPAYTKAREREKFLKSGQGREGLDRQFGRRS